MPSYWHAMSSPPPPPPPFILLQSVSLGRLQDMTTLSYLNEPGVLHNLRTRYTMDDIYTYTGSILIAVNPFQKLGHLYGAHMMDLYRGRNLGELSPHVYAIADAAYNQMRRWNKSQSILVRCPMIRSSRGRPCRRAAVRRQHSTAANTCRTTEHAPGSPCCGGGSAPRAAEQPSPIC